MSKVFLEQCVTEAAKRIKKSVRPRLKAHPVKIGHYTVGYGHLISGLEKSVVLGKPGQHISSFRVTTEEADLLLAEDLEKVFKYLRMKKELPDSLEDVAKELARHMERWVR